MPGEEGEKQIGLFFGYLGLFNTVKLWLMFSLENRFSTIRSYLPCAGLPSSRGCRMFISWCFLALINTQGGLSCHPAGATSHRPKG